MPCSKVQSGKLNSSISPKESEAIIKNLSSKRAQGSHNFSAEFYQTFVEELITILPNLLHKIETEGILPKSFYEAMVTLIPKQHNNTTKKENFRLILLMSIDAKILNKILTNRI